MKDNGNAMDGETLDLFTKLSDSTVKDDWQKALNSLFITLEKPLSLITLPFIWSRRPALIRSPFMRGR